MFNKVLLICLFFVAQWSDGDSAYGGPAVGRRKWNDFRVRFSPNGEKDGYYPMPKNLQDPLLKNYVLVPNPGPYRDHLNLPTYCYPDDPRVCVLMDKNGITAGIQVSFLKDELKKGVNGPFLYDYSRIPMYEQSNLLNKPAYTIRVFFANPTQLKTGGRKNTGETADGVWVHLDEGWVEMDRTQPLPNNDIHGPMKNFIKQACYPGMGLHYFYKLTEQSKCESLQTFFPLYQNGHMVAFGLGGFGKAGYNKRQWFESGASSSIVPRRPACQDEWATKMGFNTFHIYLVDEPWKISCPSTH